ncbi:nucleoside phosphorylase domain-containing protein [Aspergillus heterothallicus]
MTSTNRRPGSLDFRRAIICALPHEFDAVEALFDEHYCSALVVKHHKDSNLYSTGRINADYVVLTCLAKMGKVTAGIASSMIRNSFPNIDLTLLVGICGGVPFPARDTELILGDVIISHQVIEYDFGRQYPDRFEQKEGVLDILDRSNQEIRSFLSWLQTRTEKDRFQDIHNGYIQFLEQKDLKWQYPGAHQDLLFSSSGQQVNVEPESNHNCDNIECQGKLVKRRRLAQQGVPKALVHLGLIASGDTVMKSAKHRDELARIFPIIGFEMEGAGVYNSLSCLIIKGACDYADSHKNKVWQNYAAASAAACAKTLLKRLGELRIECTPPYVPSGSNR